MPQLLKTDVFISGGGPIGLLVAYSLARQGVESLMVGVYNNLRLLFVLYSSNIMQANRFFKEQFDKGQQAMYGRATTMYPRTLEMLDQLDLLDVMNQIGFIGRSSVTYKDGERVTSRGWHVLFERMYGTHLDYLLNIRQKYAEEVIRNAYKRLGAEPYIGWKLESFSVDHEGEDDYKVTSHIRNLGTEELATVKSKYIVGADGGHSLVRRLAGIAFEGERTDYRWVRIDGYFKTNMPDADIGFAAIESKSHGTVLWVQLDHGVKRIGFAMTSGMLTKYGDQFTEEDAKREAIKSMEPFTLEFESVEWWTLYSITQRVADTFIRDDRILLAGDACHTHSSGAAQGMNTGIHDAVNLSWKMSGLIKGWYTKDVLQTYDTERRAAALYLIELDKAFSATISGSIPDAYKSRYANANELFTKLFDETIQFSIGLGVHYEENIINKPPRTGMISAGWRAPDALVYAPGSRLPARLFTLTKNCGQWSIIVFAGEPTETLVKLSVATEDLSKFAMTLPKGMIRFLTIIGQNVTQGDKLFQIPRLGYIYFDQDQSAHAAYSISPASGAVVILRPDGLLAHATTLDDVGSAIAFLSSFTRSVA
ncbi:pentachlorophenol 4-monooxygenase [Aspergillus lucknowensis]|uniref:Pentachlorophenol 4-monooxygenase n=1 Tax=Aspergillus lucknowensis TaxID=176173 RepID=A0ABR4LEW9_9EURO